MGWYFLFFFLSGACSILYELIWLRLAMAQFGVTTALTSITLSVFMLGIGVGSWGAGQLVRRGRTNGRTALRLYALCEFVIGCSSLIAPAELALGHRILALLVGNSTTASGIYYFESGLLIALTLLPWCACMGATYPLAMAAIEADATVKSRRSFSYLYLSNVIGALMGAIVPLFLIELEGFHGALRVGCALNALIAISAFGLSLTRKETAVSDAPIQETAAALAATPEKGTLALLFLTGLSTMGMEVIWIRLYTPYAGPLVYSFAMILAFYLLATCIGVILYRDASRKAQPNNPLAWVSLALVGLFPLLSSDPRLALGAIARIGLGILPFAVLIGFLTPMLVDRWSAGDPDRAGRAYAVNVLGCILGPLLSGFVLLPSFGEHISMLLYVIPWIAMAFLGSSRIPLTQRIVGYAIVASSLALFLFTKNYEILFPERRVMRDSTATVIAFRMGPNKALLTNGEGMTFLTPVTKMMAHLTLASLDHSPRKVLVICFGMGTTYRSVLSWGVSGTAVELVPSVPKLFSYFHADGDRVLASPQSHVVIDDGRRFLERSTEKFDAIILDPPPNMHAAASSLLYSEQFYAVAKERLASGGILQQWLPSGDSAVRAAIAKALQQSFPYIVSYSSVNGWGWHFLASMQPIPMRSAAELASRMPQSAITDMMEWGPAATPEAQFQRILSKPHSLQELIDGSPATPALTDDRPINEYFALRTFAKNRDEGKPIAAAW